VAIKESIQLDKKTISLEDKEPFIRTMEKDMRSLGKPGLPKSVQPSKGSPPSGLPIIGPSRIPVPLRPRTIEIPKAPLKIEPLRPKSLAIKPFSKIEPKKKKVESRPKFDPRLVLIGLLVVLVVAGAGGFFYWWNYIRVVTPITHYECQAYQCVSVEGEGEDQCQTNQDCEPTEPAVPSSLIPVDGTETIELNVEEQDLLSSKIDEVILGGQTAGSLERILVKLVIAQEKRYASFSEFVNMLNMVVPDDLMVDDYTVFVYRPEDNEAELCQDAGIEDERCYGSRLGLVIKSTDIETTRSAASAWEETLVSNLSSFILAQVSDSQEIGFQSDPNPSYLDSGIRYKNLSISPITVNYAFNDNLLIISTSKHSLYQALDRLIGQ